MTETGFGEGGYAYTKAEIPSAPVLAGDTSVSIFVTIGDDNNPTYTEYAIYNETDVNYVDALGDSTPTAVWQTRLSIRHGADG